jgi:hypothetical protein
MSPDEEYVATAVMLEDLGFPAIMCHLNHNHLAIKH